MTSFIWAACIWCCTWLLIHRVLLPSARLTNLCGSVADLVLLDLVCWSSAESGSAGSGSAASDPGEAGFASHLGRLHLLAASAALPASALLICGWTALAGYI